MMIMLKKVFKNGTRHTENQVITADNKVIKRNIGLYWSKLYPKDFKCFDIPDESADENGDHGGDDDDNEDDDDEEEDDN